MNNLKQTIYVPVSVEDELPSETGYYKTLEEGTSFFQKGDNTWWDNNNNIKKDSLDIGLNNNKHLSIQKNN